MDRRTPRLALILVAAAPALVLLAALLPTPLRAGGGSRSGNSASTAGPVKVETGAAMGLGAGKIQAPLDAVYWLDYAGARLYAAIPSARQTARDVALLRDFAERDLVADFGLAPGVEPKFLMQTASMGGMGGGTALLVVIEATTKQVAAYQARSKTSLLDGRPDFQCLQVISYARNPRATAPPAPAAVPGEPIGVSGPLFIQQGTDGTQAPLDVVYWLDGDRDARLHAAIPSVRRTSNEAQVLSGVGDRDLAADFKLKPGSSPRFLLNCVALGAGMQGASALFVIETSTKQIAAYRPSPRSAAGSNASAEIELIQIKPYIAPTASTLPAPN